MANITSGQSNLAKAASNPCVKLGLLWCVPWVSRSLLPKQDLDPFSCVCTAKPRYVQTNRKTDSLRETDAHATGTSTCIVRPIATDDPIAWSIWLSVTRLGWAKMAKRIEFLFGMESLGDPRNILLDYDAPTATWRAMRPSPNYIIIFFC